VSLSIVLTVKAAKELIHSESGLATVCLLQGVSLLADSENCEKRLLASSFKSIRPSVWKNSAPTGRIFMKLHI